VQSLELFERLLLSPAFEASPAAVGEVVQNRKINKIINVALCWAKTSGSVKIENQVFNSRVAVFESSLRGARERLAKQDARARTRSSSGAFAGECAEQPIESRELCTAAWRCRGLGA